MAIKNGECGCARDLVSLTCSTFITLVWRCHDRVQWDNEQVTSAKNSLPVPGFIDSSVRHWEKRARSQPGWTAAEGKEEKSNDVGTIIVELGRREKLLRPGHYFSIIARTCQAQPHSNSIRNSTQMQKQYRHENLMPLIGHFHPVLLVWLLLALQRRISFYWNRQLAREQLMEKLDKIFGTTVFGNLIEID